jgi:DNA/RNA endonuclease YhcR with UshA esterase domain
MGKLAWVLSVGMFCFWLMGCTAVSPSPSNSTPPPTEPTNQPIAQNSTIAPTNTNTPSPTFTATATNIPASPTPSPTASHTPSPTNTSTSTPSPTFTPSATPLPTWTATPATPQLTVSQLAPTADGETVSVVGRITAVSSFSRGFRFTLTDETGNVTLLLWDNVYDEAWDAPRLRPGATVWAQGKVELYEGNLQLVPTFGGHVKVREDNTAVSPLRPIGELGNHVGEQVRIQGEIARIQGGNNNSTLYVADETGDIAVFIWMNIWQRIPQNASLVPGTRVEISGPVSIFRNNRQIVPALPYDVVVLP